MERVDVPMSITDPDFREGELVLVPGSVMLFDGLWQVTVLSAGRIHVKRMD